MKNNEIIRLLRKKPWWLAVMVGLATFADKIINWLWSWFA